MDPAEATRQMMALPMAHALPFNGVTIFGADGGLEATRRLHDVVARCRKPAMIAAAFGGSDRIGVGGEHRVLRCVATASTRQRSNRRTN